MMSDPHAATDKLTQLLIVEQDLQARQSLANAVEPLPIQAHWASTPTAARKILDEAPIELVIVDIASGPSGQESGFEFALWLREQSPYAYVDLLFTSKDYPARLYRETSLLRYQALDYLDKPTPESLWTELLEQFLSGELMPPTSALALDPSRPQETAAPGAFNPDQFLLDPDEWIDAVFAAKHITMAPDAQPLPEDGPNSEQNLPSFREPTQPGRPTTEGRAKASQWQTRNPKQIIKEPTEERLREHANAAPPLPRHNHTPTPYTNPQWGTQGEAQALSPIPLHTGSSPTLPSHHHHNDPEREKPTQSLPGLTQARMPAEEAPTSEHPALSPPANDKAQSSFQRGIEALQTQQLDVALQAFYEAADLHPIPRHRAYFGWTLALSQAHDPQQVQRAEQMLIQARQDEPSLEQTHYLLGRFYQHQRRPQEAVHAYQYALSINSQFQEVYREYRLLQLQMTR